MKQILLALLFLCLSVEAICQRRILEDNSPRRRNQIYVPLPAQSQLFIAFNHWHELETHSNIDSLLHLFREDWRIFKASNSFSSEYSKILYIIPANGGRTFTPSTSIAHKKKFAIENDSLVEHGPDTLIIEKQIVSSNRLSLPNRVRLYFVVKEFDEISKYENLNAKIQQAKTLAAKHPRKDVFKPRYVSFTNLDSTNRYPVTARAYSSMPRKIIKLGVGSGIARNQLYSTLSGEFTLLPELKRTGFRVSWDEYFYFRNPANTSFRVIQGSFVNLGIVFFKPWPSIFTNNNAPPERGGLMLGYLIRRDNEYFLKDTWRLSTRVSFGRRINLEPELYWNGLFKNVYPGLRLNVAFFTNE